MSVLNNYIDDVLVSTLRERLVKALDMLPSPINERIKDYILGNSGKMLRPLLVVIAAKLLGADEEGMEKAYTQGIVIEMLHNMTLIHDDVIDGAPKRRGRPSYHITHGIDRALHDGDVLHAFALTVISDLNAMKLIADISYEVGKGNAFELEDRLNNVFDFTPERVFEVMTLKTAIVFYGCIQLAFMSAGKEAEFDAELKEIIINGGIAFQLQDDILDVIGSSEQFGKESFWDIQESKRNLFLYYALQTPHVKRITEICKKPVGEKTAEDIDFVVSVFKGVTDQVIRSRDEFLEKSLDELSSLKTRVISPEKRKMLDFLDELIVYLGTRQK